jgi:uncharacterized membrane protein
MTKQQYIIEINKAINRLPEDTLPEVLQYLNSLGNISTEDITIAKNLNKIIREDRNLLKKLAE